MKKNHYLMATVLVAMAFVVGATVFVDTDPADAVETELTVVPVSETIVIGPGGEDTLDLDGKDITFTGEGKYVIKEGGTLSIGSALMYTQFQLNGAGEVIVLEPGAIVEIMGSPTTISSETVVDLDGTIQAYVSVNVMTMSVDIDIDVQKDDVLSIAGFAFVGGSSSELYVKVTSDIATPDSITAIMTIDAPKFTIPEIGGVAGSIVMESVTMDIKMVIGEENIAITGINSDKAIVSIGNMALTMNATSEMPFDVVMNSGSVMMEVDGNGSPSDLNLAMKCVAASSGVKIMEEDKVIGDVKTVNSVTNIIMGLSIDPTAGVTDMGVSVDSTLEECTIDMTYVKDGVEVSMDQVLEDGAFAFEVSLDGNPTMGLSVGSYTADIVANGEGSAVVGKLDMTGLVIEAVAVLDMDAIMGSILDIFPETTPDVTPDLAYEVIPTIDLDMIEFFELEVNVASFDMGVTVTEGTQTMNLDLGIDNIEVCYDVDSNLDQAILVTVGGISADINAKDGKTESVLSATVGDLGVLVEMDADGVSDVTVDIGSIVAKGDVPANDEGIDSVDIAVTGVTLATVPSEVIVFQPAIIKIAAIDGAIVTKSNVITIDGSGISSEITEEATVVELGSLDLDIGVPLGTFQNSEVTADMFVMTMDESGVDFQGTLVRTMVRPDGSTATMTLSNINGKDTCAYSGYGAEDALYVSPMYDVAIVLDKVYVDYIDLSSIEDVSGEFYLYNQGLVIHDGGELSNNGVGVSVRVKVDSSTIVEATLFLETGYTSIPSHYDGIDYEVSADKKTAVLSGFDGTVIVIAEGQTYEITAGDKIIDVKIGGMITIPAPAQGPTNLTFFGWTDGTIIVEDGDTYTHLVPHDVVMAPIWVGGTAVLQGDKLVFDVKTGNGIIVSDVTSLGSDYLNADSIVVNTQDGDIQIPTYNTLAGSTYNDIEATIVVIDVPNDKVAAAIDGATLYNVESNVVGTDFSIKYALEGADADSVKLYAVNEYGVIINVIDYDVKVIDGTAIVTFNPANSGSVDVIGFFVDVEEGSTPSEPDEGGISITFIAGIVVGILIVAVVAVFLVKRKP